MTSERKFFYCRPCLRCERTAPTWHFQLCHRIWDCVLRNKKGMRRTSLPAGAAQCGRRKHYLSCCQTQYQTEPFLSKIVDDLPARYYGTNIQCDFNTCVALANLARVVSLGADSGTGPTRRARRLAAGERVCRNVYDFTAHCIPGESFSPWSTFCWRGVSSRYVCAVEPCCGPVTH